MKKLMPFQQFNLDVAALKNDYKLEGELEAGDTLYMNGSYGRTLDLYDEGSPVYLTLGAVYDYEINADLPLTKNANEALGILQSIENDFYLNEAAIVALEPIHGNKHGRNRYALIIDIAPNSDLEDGFYSYTYHESIEDVFDHIENLEI